MAGFFFFIPSNGEAEDKSELQGAQSISSSPLASYILKWQTEHFTSHCLEHLTTYIWEQCQVAVSRLQLLEALVTVHAGLAWHDSGEE